GVVDEGTGDDPVCPGGSSCTMCQCALPCAPSVEFVAACPNGKAAVTDDNGCFCVAERCNDRSCGSQTLSVNDEVQCEPRSTRVAACSCKNNECTFACAGVLCADGLVCDPTDGRCRQASCLLPQFPCPDGQRCGLADGVFECTADACAGVTCGGDEACRDGSCVKSCARVTCNDGQVCRDGACEDNRCNGVSCGAEQVCDVSNGDCVERAACAVSGCPLGTVCDPVAGTCNEDPCLRTSCSAAERCNASGQCELRCAPEQAFCDGACIDPSSNRDHCGASAGCQGDDAGESCAAELVCSEGRCSDTCSEGRVNCSGSCINALTDRDHCGASGDCSGEGAGLHCTVSERCVDGRCLGPQVDAGQTQPVGRGLVATGGGGCACSVGPGRSSAPSGGLGALVSLVALAALGLRRRLRLRGAALIAGVLASLLSSGCKVNSFCLDCTRDAGAVDSGTIQPPPVLDAGPGPGPGPDAQQPDPDAGRDSGSIVADSGPSRPDACGLVEVCNSLDDDCDGRVDENIDTSASGGADLQSDPRHCGSCGNACVIEHAFNRCNAGVCEVDRSQGDNGCDIGYTDLDGDGANGCEYRCTRTADEDTACNQSDDDCDTKIDEDVKLDTDPNNCGRCGLRCIFAHAAEGARCTDKTCALDPTRCDEGFIDADGRALTGCEYKCPVTPTVVETCNSVDDDCDGKVDEEITPAADPRLGVACGSTTGECRAGATTCVQGAPTCTGGVVSAIESCDTKDNDCDGKVDEDFDTQKDLGHCGSCGNKCLFDANVGNAHATLICGSGQCRIGACLGDYADSDDNYRNGCETTCVVSGTEVCDGRDNDCNGDVDDNVDAPAVVCRSREFGVCAANANTLAALRARGPQCVNATLSCNPANAGTGMIPNVQATETACDGLDNDCDGRVDEMRPEVGKACSKGKGACLTTGVNVCDGASFRCNAAEPGAGSAEQCDGLDNDCDERIDEFATPTASTQIAGITTVPLGAGNGNVLIMAYEASRADATASNVGKLGGKPCSAANKQPWSNATYGEAEAACCALNAAGTCSQDNKGWRLCDATEWVAACRGSSATCDWGYSNVASAQCSHLSSDTTYRNVCLGSEAAGTVTCPSGVTQCAAATGASTFAECKAPFGSGVFDMSGNLKEWTRNPPPGTTLPAGVHQLRGGSYNNLEGGRRCDFDFAVGDTNFRVPNTGFRCCYYP
ncbi:MAG: MopE-related protein, partial [Polyangiales bacterium]